MIKYLRNEEIDRKLWDSCVDAARPHKPYGYSWYLDIMSPGWEALADDDYQAVFPLPARSKFGIRYLATPVFLQNLDAYSPDRTASGSVSEFLDFIPPFFRLIDICVGHEPVSNKYRITKRINYQLHLNDSYDITRKMFSDHCKRNIDTGHKRNKSITGEITPDELTTLFVGNRGREIYGIRASDYSRLRELIRYCSDKGKGRIIGVRNEEMKLIYGIFLIDFRKCSTMLFVVNTPESREKRTGYFIIDNLIREMASSGTLLDFAGSMVPSVAAFMGSFGAAPSAYWRIYRNRLPFPAWFSH